VHETLNALALGTLLEGFRLAASGLPDSRRGSNKRFTLTDAAGSALAPLFLQDPSFLSFQRRIEDEEARSNCQSLFGIGRIPTDNTIRNLLDGCPSDAFDSLFPRCLEALDENGALEPFRRLDGRIPVALDGIEFHKSGKVKCPLCSIRHVGNDKTAQFLHSMVGAAVVADGHRGVVPLMPEFVRPQHDPAARDAARSGQSRKQDCERNAVKRWIRRNCATFAPYRPVYLGDDLLCRHPVCHLLDENNADWIFVCKPTSHKCLEASLQEHRIRSTGWIRVRNARHRIEHHPYRWQSGVPVRDGADAVTGTWVEFRVQRRKPGATEGKQTYFNTFFTSLEVTRDNVAEIARAGRARRKIENEGFNCLSRQGYNLKHNFGHGDEGPANLPAVFNLLALAFHTVPDSLRGLWREARERLVTRRDFFEHLRVLTHYFHFPHWVALPETLLKRRGQSTATEARGPTRA